MSHKSNRTNLKTHKFCCQESIAQPLSNFESYYVTLTDMEENLVSAMSNIDGISDANKDKLQIFCPMLKNVTMSDFLMANAALAELIKKFPTESTASMIIYK